MERPIMFNGRLNKDEVDTWLNLLYETSESGFKERKLAKAFLHLPESITFVSSLETRIIGGTSIYRDRTRLAMVLASVAVRHEFRDSAAFQIIKSSMPFFKTVAIRDVDALVSQDTRVRAIGYPLSLELDAWVIDILRRIGFKDVGTLEHWSFEMKNETRKSPVNWSKDIDMNKVKELIWDQSKSMGLTNSLVWLARDFASSSLCLVASTTNGQTSGVAGLWELADAICITPLVTDPERLSWDQVAESLISEMTGRSRSRIELPLIGKGQSSLVQILKEKSDRFSCRKLSLLRKQL